MSEIVRNSRIIYAAVPTGFPEPGIHLTYNDSLTIDLENVPLNGGLLIKTVALSIDPYMRTIMLGADIDGEKYLLDQPILGYGIGIVLRSEISDIRPGQYVHVDALGNSAVIPLARVTLTRQPEHAEYSVASVSAGVRVMKRSTSLPWSVYVGAAGMAGQTAFYGWREHAPAKKGSTLYVSTGAGAVGSMVIQLAKRDGMRVIASAGTQEKIDFLKEIGADVAFNYKETSVRELLAKQGPVDIYWDNVGGDTLDAALENMSVGGAIIICGYSTNAGSAPASSLMKMVYKDVHMVGFGFNTLEHKYLDEFYATIPPKLESGELKFREEVFRSLDKVPEALLRVLTGKNRGKAVVVLSDG
ncbi:hypothetical protein D9757_008938 [Collybiopsis confluens]|uniref:Enoyl reductase (ER) domain-containing protein n=1 Tax=Collybiopsis confluens TaxID=2823264 RepID=A0A8H5M6A5_9AGAR|nr:hypothetical protein D9757_008938 [Collybiopsis confluens]